jgi:hypothetical protein
MEVSIVKLAGPSNEQPPAGPRAGRARGAAHPYGRGPHRLVMMISLALVAVFVMGFSTQAHARIPRDRDPRAPRQGFSAAYRMIVADDNFHANYDRYKRQYPQFNWGNDGCSGPARFTGYSDNFFWPCVQHDFGYRNNRIASQHNEAARQFVDSEFRQHMKQICGRYDSAIRKRPARWSCNGAADAFYTAVRARAQSAWN